MKDKETLFNELREKYYHLGLGDAFLRDFAEWIARRSAEDECGTLLELIQRHTDRRVTEARMKAGSPKGTEIRMNLAASIFNTLMKTESSPFIPDVTSKAIEVTRNIYYALERDEVHGEP